MNVLITGGAGYIGSHTCVELLNSNYDIIIVDNFSNSKREVIEKIKQTTNREFKFYEVDCCDKSAISKIFDENKIDVVVHFAGYKAVGESVSNPILYYRNNLDSTITLLEVMNEHNVKKIVFSSSATVYGKTEKLPIKEDFPLSTTNPYATTKLIIEGLLGDLYKSDNSWAIAILRYFNPIGAHKLCLIGENPNGIPNNLMPYIIKVANHELECLNVFGNDYNTPDGTGVRDYIHVVDLATGHIKAIEKVLTEPGIDAYNLGTGKGYSVLDLINIFMRVNNVDVNYKIVDRRPGDVDAYYADVNYAKEKLNWEPKYGIEEMCEDSYNYVKKYKKA